MKNLISNTSFGDYLRTKNLPDYEYRFLRDKFDDFLKQPLELWMFVPCKLVDGVWAVLEEPDADYYMKVTEKDLKEYQEAKDRVLFKGFEIDYDRIVKNNEIRIQFNDYSTYLNNSKTVISTIEHLVKHNLELTPTALKQIG